MYSRLGQDVPAAPTSDFLNVTGGISAILAPLAQVGVSVYQTQQLQKLEKARMKAEMASQNAMAMMPQQQAPVIVQSSSGLLIGVVVGGAALLGVLVFALTRKKDESGVAASSSTTTSEAPRSTAPRIKRIKRISRPKNFY
jgi:hypothetical protein